MKVHEEVLHSLREWGDKPTVIEVGSTGPDRVLTANELIRGIKDTSDFLRAAGVQSGIQVAIFLGNSTEFLQVFLAICSLGAIPVLLKLEYRKLELDEIFANSMPSVVIVEKHHLESLRSYLKDLTIIAFEKGLFWVVQEAVYLPREPDLPIDIASLIYTYRGLGYPLAAMIPHDQYLQGAKSFQELTQGVAGESLLFSLPMSHILTLVGCILVPLLNRMTIVLARTLHPNRIFSAIRKYRIERIIAVPEVYFFLIRLFDSSSDISSLKVLVSGGSILTAADHKLIKNTFNTEILNGYGLTELAPVSGHSRGEARPGTVGVPCSPIEVRIDSVCDSEEGEILIRSPHMFRGYFRREAETREALIKGWFSTGDLGKFDRGHLVFIREKKNTCKVNGSLVDLEEVRRAILQDPDIPEAVVEGCNNKISAQIAISHHIDLKEKTRLLHSSLRTLLADNKMPARIMKM